MSCWSLMLMMLRFQVMVVCLWFFSVLGSAQAESWPARTAFQAPIASTLDAFPVPTCTDSTASERLFKRAEEAVDSVCGFVTSDAHYPIACNEGELCTSFEHERAWRCCQTASVSVSGFETYTLGLNCTYLGATTCYDRNHTAACTGACLSTAPVCKDANYPACASLISTDVYAFNYTVAFCDTTAYTLPVEWGTVDPATAQATSTPEGYTFTFAKPSGTSEAAAAATSWSVSLPSTTSSQASVSRYPSLALEIAGVLFLMVSLS